MNLYYIFVIILFLVILYYSVKYLFFVLLGMILSLYLSYRYLLPIIRKTSI